VKIIHKFEKIRKKEILKQSDSDNSSRSGGRKPKERVKVAESCRNAGFCASSGRLHPAIQLWFPLRSPRRALLSFAISFSLLDMTEKTLQFRETDEQTAVILCVKRERERYFG